MHIKVYLLWKLMFYNFYFLTTQEDTGWCGRIDIKTSALYVVKYVRSSDYIPRTHKLKPLKETYRHMRLNTNVNLLLMRAFLLFISCQRDNEGKVTLIISFAKQMR